MSSRTELECEHVLTGSSREEFCYEKCGLRDISSKFPDLTSERCFAIRINFNKKFCFANIRTANEFCCARNEFIQRTTLSSPSCDFVQFEQGFDLERIHFRNALIALPDPQAQPWFASSVMFYFCSFFLLSWPLRILLEYNTIQLKYDVSFSHMKIQYRF